jgi:hypothetical protein
MSDLKDIWSPEGDLDNEALMRYLQGKASEEERYAVEKQMAGSDFVNDAVEGLQQFSSTREVQHLTEQLNRQLRKETSATQLRKRRRRIKDQPWTIIAIIVIVVLCILGFLVIRMITNS